MGVHISEWIHGKTVSALKYRRAENKFFEVTVNQRSCSRFGLQKSRDFKQ